MGVREKLEKTGPRKLLALDSGGIRGLITIEILAEIEHTLGKLAGESRDFVLADYFDYIGGTSTGAIIAACLSLGMRVAQIRELFQQHGGEMFQSAPWWQRWRYKYRCDRLCGLIKEVIRRIAGEPSDGELDHCLGTDKLRTLLLLVMRNASTDSLWPISNHPGSRFNCDIGDPGCNLKLPLWQLIRASAAAPTFFAPEVVKLGSQRFVFDDGAMTPCVNPALQLFLMATARPYKLCWPTGEDRLLLVSVGTGRFDRARPVIKAQGEHLLYSASNIPKVLIGENTVYHDFLCRVFGKCLTGDVIDAEVGDLISEPVGLIEPRLFSYLRYNADLSDRGLKPLGFTAVESNRVRRLDSLDCISQLQSVGRAAAQNVLAEHFARFPPTD